MHQPPALRRQTGFTLIEILIGLSIFALIIVGGLSIVPGIRLSAAVNTEMQNLSLIQAAAGTYYDNFQAVPSSASALASLVPDLQSLKPSGANLESRWGSITVDEDTSSPPSGYMVTYSGVPKNACQKLVPTQLKNWDGIKVNNSTETKTDATSADIITLVKACADPSTIIFYGKSIS
jgi:prepilin-type N-terminal cleavage/methylation domain-containing protein